METFSAESQGVGIPPEALSSNLDRLETHERRSTTYALVALAAASIRAAALAMSRDELDVLAEVALSVDVEI